MHKSRSWILMAVSQGPDPAGAYWLWATDGRVDGSTATNNWSDYPMLGFLVLGAVFLALTGGEALYADMGHFGRRSIRIAWIALVFPALLLNYFGQAAFVLANPAGIKNPAQATTGLSAPRRREERLGLGRNWSGKMSSVKDNGISG